MAAQLDRYAKLDKPIKIICLHPSLGHQKWLASLLSPGRFRDDRLGQVIAKAIGHNKPLERMKLRFLVIN